MCRVLGLWGTRWSAHGTSLFQVSGGSCGYLLLQSLDVVPGRSPSVPLQGFEGVGECVDSAFDIVVGMGG